MKYSFSLAGFSLNLDIPFSFQMGEDAAPFCIPSVDTPDEQIRFLPKAPVPPESTGSWQGLTLFHGDEAYRYLSKSGKPYACMNWDEGICYYDPERPECLWSSKNIWNAIGLETLLLHHQRLLLHSAFIRHEGRGILFSAPSGTGKSTQARLWEEFAGAEVLNGDRAALSCTDGKWTAWGLPYAGSSGIYRNESAALAAIVILRQAKENRIRKLSASQALGCILPELNLHRWDVDYMNRAMNLIIDLIQNTDIYLLECLPDEGAVRLLQRTLSERRTTHGNGNSTG